MTKTEKATATPPRASLENAHLRRVAGWQKHLETGVLDAVVLVNPYGPHFDRVLQAVNIVNSAQSYYRLRLELDEAGAFLTNTTTTKLADPIHAKIRKAWPSQLVLAMAEHDLDEDGLSISEEPGCTVISCADWDGDDNAPAMRVYLVYQMTSALVTFAGCLSLAENDSLLHGYLESDSSEKDETEDDDNNAPRGCLFDYWLDSENLYVSMVSARLCDRCRTRLLAHGTPRSAIAATEKLLEWIRSVILGREDPLPQKIFIGHGRNEDWKLLKEMLTEWGLSVEEFNEEPVAGTSITQRLKAMLERSRFAFLVMTGEDKDDEGQLQARMNVIHEIGLFQGRLGTEYAVVLRRKDARLFSNLDGINRLDYQLGKLEDLKAELHRLLIGRGVMSADVGTNQHNNSFRTNERPRQGKEKKN